jgi:transcriptional regulator with XRE-family HTH domain
MASQPKDSEFDFKLAGVRLRQRRIDLGLTTQQVADRARVARFTVVRLEKGLPCHRATLEKIRAALRLFTDQLLRPFDDTSNCAIQRASDLRWSVAKSKRTYQRQDVEDDRIHVDDEGERKRLGLLELQPFFTAVFTSELPRSRSGQALMEFHQPSWVDRHFGEEFVYCLRGPVTISVEGIPQRLETGDAMTFDATLPHQYAPSEPIGPKDPPALILVVVTKEPIGRRRGGPRPPKS